MSQPSRFQRFIDYAISQQDDGQFFLQAQLRDRFHDLEIQVITTPDTLEILTINATMRKGPSPFCPRVEQQIQQLVGFQIGRGLNRKLAEVLGGSHGCGNLRTMLIGLLPLALNARAGLGCDSDDEALANIAVQLKGTCAGYPEQP